MGVVSGVASTAASGGDVPSCKSYTKEVLMACGVELYPNTKRIKNITNDYYKFQVKK